MLPGSLYLAINRQTIWRYPNGNAWCRDFRSPSKCVISVVYHTFFGLRVFANFITVVAEIMIRFNLSIVETNLVRFTFRVSQDSITLQWFFQVSFSVCWLYVVAWACSSAAEDVRSTTRKSCGLIMMILHLQTLEFRVVTLSPPVHTSCIASKMATQRDVEYNQTFLNTCVLLDGPWLMTVLIVTHYSSPGPSASQSAGQGCVNPFFCVVILVKNHPGTALISSNRMEDLPSNALLWQVRVL